MCLAGDDHPTSRALFATAEEPGSSGGDPAVAMAGTVAGGDVPIADPVADRIEDAGCPVLAWTGGTAGRGGGPFPAAGGPGARGRSLEDQDRRWAGAGHRRPRRRHHLRVCEREPVPGAGAHAVRARSPGCERGSARSVRGGGVRRRPVLAGSRHRRGKRTVSGGRSPPRSRSSASSPVSTGTYRFDRDGSRAAETLRWGRWRAMGFEWLPVEPDAGASA